MKVTIKIGTPDHPRIRVRDLQIGQAGYSDPHIFYLKTDVSSGLRMFKDTGSVEVFTSLNETFWKQEVTVIPASTISIQTND